MAHWNYENELILAKSRLHAKVDAAVQDNQHLVYLDAGRALVLLAYKLVAALSEQSPRATYYYVNKHAPVSDAPYPRLTLR